MPGIPDFGPAGLNPGRSGASTRWIRIPAVPDTGRFQCPPTRARSCAWSRRIRTDHHSAKLHRGGAGSSSNCRMLWCRATISARSAPSSGHTPQDVVPPFPPRLPLRVPSPPPGGFALSTAGLASIVNRGINTDMPTPPRPRTSMARPAKVSDAQPLPEPLVNELYWRDSSSWSLEQADALRRRDFDAVDWGNVKEEIEDLARSDARRLTSQYARIPQKPILFPVGSNLFNTPVLKFRRSLTTAIASKLLGSMSSARLGGLAGAPPSPLSSTRPQGESSPMQRKTASKSALLANGTAPCPETIPIPFTRSRLRSGIPIQNLRLAGRPREMPYPPGTTGRARFLPPASGLSFLFSRTGR